MKLYLVETVGIGSHYIVAENAQEAYDILEAELDKRDYGLIDDRRLIGIKLLASREDFFNRRSVLRIKESKP